MPFEPIENPFGGVDEQATIDKAADLCGGKHKLEMMAALYKQCCPTLNYGRYNGKTKNQVFLDAAKSRGIPQEHAEAFLVLTEVA